MIPGSVMCDVFPWISYICVSAVYSVSVCLCVSIPVCVSKLYVCLCVSTIPGTVCVSVYLSICPTNECLICCLIVYCLPIVLICEGAGQSGGSVRASGRQAGRQAGRAGRQAGRAGRQGRQAGRAGRQAGRQGRQAGQAEVVGKANLQSQYTQEQQVHVIHVTPPAFAKAARPLLSGCGMKF
jgi:hypothetical protein